MAKLQKCHISKSFLLLLSETPVCRHSQKYSKHLNMSTGRIHNTNFVPKHRHKIQGLVDQDTSGPPLYRYVS